MTATKFRKHPIAVLRRHWTIHALQQFCARYDPADYEPEALIDLVDRIEGKYRTAFANPYWDRHSRVMIVAKLTRRNPAVSPKVRIVYDRRAKVIVTVLPLKLDPNRPHRLKTLTV
ncbi:hypothetical protein AA309_23485 [Microvirga vignae]|uniref:Uncharacterized protein n=1 Tax=Microvirga vignae TaxID=1225564 RepID=A0A0H1R6X2_9HYPH|nr:hypothetical protein [Microvirga vignae]KLK90883.1 hypothetical protein AA309_23485 [Microvirga vignae]